MSAIICKLEDIADGGSAGFQAEIDGAGKRILAVRQGGRVYAYINICPHIGAPLDLIPGDFMSMDRQHILCTNHGALFEIASGDCIAGPCVGKALERVEIVVEDGEVRLAP